MTVCRKTGWIGGLALGLSGCVLEPPEELAVWSEFAPARAVVDQLGLLAEFNCAAYVAVRPENVNEDWWALLRQARDAGVQIRPWLLLPASRGLWLNESNIDEYWVFAHSMLDEASARAIAVEWIILDVEPDHGLAEAVSGAALEGGFGEAAELLWEQRDPVRFSGSTARLSEFVGSLQSRGVKVMCVQLPWVLDDLRDGDSDIQDVFNTPLARIAWDQVAVMLYRPVFRDLSGLPLSTAFVSTYSVDLLERFGSGSQVALGTLGSVGVLTAPGYERAAELAPDIAAARSQGVQSISIYSLDGALEQDGLRALLEVASGKTRFFPQPAAATRWFRGAVRAADWLIGRIDGRASEAGGESRRNDGA